MRIVFAIVMFAGVIAVAAAPRNEPVLADAKKPVEVWSGATRFSAGGYDVNLKPYSANVMPTMTFAGRSFSFAYTTSGWLQDGDSRIRFRSDPTNRLASLTKMAEGVKAEYVHSLYTGRDPDRRFVGICSNEVVFADGVARVRATLYPAEPGKYRFHASHRASQVIVFAGYAKKWVGTTLHMFSSRERMFMNELTPHAMFDPKAWGMNANDTGYVREMVFGNVPGVIRFIDAGDAGFNANRYPGGFEANAVFVNGDVMHKPAWDGPVAFSYMVKMEK